MPIESLFDGSPNGQPVMVCVDPGDVHVGVAFFLQDDALEHGWRCYDAKEMTPDDFLDLFTEMVVKNAVKVVVFERFRLYSDKSVEQTGSEFATAQVIGVIKYVVRAHNRHADRHARACKQNLRMTCEGSEENDCVPSALLQPVYLVGQMADIKKPTRGILRFRGIKSKAVARREAIHAGGRACAKDHCHAVDAELHGWRWIFKPDKAHVYASPPGWKVPVRAGNDTSWRDEIEE